MEMRMPFISATISAIALLAGAAYAGEYPMTFEQLDVDGNGYLSAQETQARPGLADQMQASDTDGDGQLNITEFSAFEGKNRFTPPEESEVSEPGAAPY